MELRANAAHDQSRSPAPPRRGTKGDEIRQRIAANRAKRLAISETMKREAGVRHHDINDKNLDGLARPGAAYIHSPEGRNIEQLYTLAHECGHIYLPSDAEGLALPTHVKEMEAESYAHQAFARHGMKVPYYDSFLGRLYVDCWIKKDRAAGIAIDPRVEAYVRGLRRPFEPLRKTPFTWRCEKARAALAYEVAVRAPAGTYLEIIDPASEPPPHVPVSSGTRDLVIGCGRCLWVGGWGAGSICIWLLLLDRNDALHQIPLATTLDVWGLGFMIGLVWTMIWATWRVIVRSRY